MLTAHKDHHVKTRQVQASRELTDGTLNFLTAFDPVQARYMGRELRGMISWLAYYYEDSHDVCHDSQKPIKLGETADSMHIALVDPAHRCLYPSP